MRRQLWTEDKVFTWQELIGQLDHSFMKWLDTGVGSSGKDGKHTENQYDGTDLWLCLLHITPYQ
jgi:hypothetical protein